MFTLLCYVRSDDQNRVFEVKIGQDESVAALKEAIKEKRSQTFRDIDADSLILWNVSVPFNRNLGENVEVLNLVHDGSLQPPDILSDVFPSGVEKRRVHIVVERPPVIHLPPLLRLLCYIRGDDYKHAFEVKIGQDESVAALKEAIKEKKSQTFRDIDADSLILWNVSVPFNRYLKENVDKLSLVDDDQLFATHLNGKQIQSLLPAQNLSEIFLDSPTKNHVHIVANPPPSQSTIKQAAPEEKDDIVTALTTRCEEAVKKARNAKSPSESAKSKEYRVYQQDLPIHDGRYDAKNPVETTAPPVQLFHPAFGHFLDDLSSDLSPSPEVSKATVDYMRAASAIYDSEASRRHAIEPHLHRILGMALTTAVNADKTSPDGMISISQAGPICEAVVVLLEECKNEVGQGSCDPSIQAGLSVVRFWVQKEHDMVRNNTCCPTFLLAIAGPWFTILGAVFTDKWIIQRLTDFIWVGLDATLNEPHCTRVAHVMHSLSRNVGKLYEYYAELKIIPASQNNLHPRFFPSIRAYRDEDGGIIEFEYIQPLEIESTCVTFLARTTTDAPKTVVVKFVQRYGDEAHRLLAKKDLAPQLFYYGRIGVLEGDPSYGHLSMAVMEYIDGETLDKANRIPQNLKDQIQHALDVLHSHGYVFGDLRQPNVMITKNGEVKLIDFDWAGSHKKSQYPLLISPNLMWPAGVGALSIMETKHDIDMLTRLLPAEQ